MQFDTTTGRKPCLATVLVGDDPASHTYVRMKANRCRTAGLDSRRHHLRDTASTTDVVALVSELANDDTVDGILVQHPMPPQVDERRVLCSKRSRKPRTSTVSPVLHSRRWHWATKDSIPGTPGGIMCLLDAYDVDPAGQRAVVIGRSAILGKPVGMLLLARDATVTYCHSKTTDLASVVNEADIVVAAVGRPELIKGNWIKPGAVVIDAGYNLGNVGDVEYAAAAQRASLITPVPGGVGPTTIAVLLAQTVQAADAAHNQ